MRPAAGGALQSEILSSDAKAADFAVYPVTRTLIASVLRWPRVNNSHLGWITASQGSVGRVVRPGDIVTLAIWDSDPNSLLVPTDGRQTVMESVRVSPGGTIFVPYVGEVAIGGSSPESTRAKVQT